MAALGQINTLKCGATDTLNPTADMVETHTHTHHITSGTFSRKHNNKRALSFYTDTANHVAQR